MLLLLCQVATPLVLCHILQANSVLSSKQILKIREEKKDQAEMLQIFLNNIGCAKGPSAVHEMFSLCSERERLLVLKKINK